MFSDVFLAMTAQEMMTASPKSCAYMACRFSPYGAGLSGMPETLPEGSILLLDDSMPVQNHDPVLVAGQMQELVERFSVRAVVLDFQGETTESAHHMADALLQALPCPVAATKDYAVKLRCPVFLPPVPVTVRLQGYLAPWLSQGVYLEIAPESMQITVTAAGSRCAPAPLSCDLPLEDTNLRCHYKTQVFPDKAVFTLQRTKEDLAQLSQDAYKFGVQAIIGLYQELNCI